MRYLFRSLIIVSVILITLTVNGCSSPGATPSSPPVTQPPVTQSPVTKPPVTQSPTAQSPTSQPPSTQPPATSQAPGPGGGVPALSPTGSITTAGTLSAAGQTVYAGKCASCHGDSGQGKTAAALIGSGAQLAKYSTAGALYQKINTTMPMNAPGSLTPADYLNVTTYILVQNNYVNASSQISKGALDSIPLK